MSDPNKSFRTIDTPMKGKSVGIKGKSIGSRRPIRRIVWRRRYDADARGEVHLTLAEHVPNPGFAEGRLFLHLHVEHAVSGYSKNIPAALDARQLAGLIRSLQSILDEMSPGDPLSAPEPCASDDAKPQHLAQQ